MYALAVAPIAIGGKNVEFNPENGDKLEKHAAWFIRGAIFATGVAGLTIFARSMRLFTRFGHARQIPNEFFRKNVQLRGSVAYITQEGTLRVNHIPVFRSPLAWLRRKAVSESENTGKLSVNIAGVELTHGGKEWLRTHFVWRPIWFTLIRKMNEDELQCEVFVKKGRFSKSNINRELIRRGMARVPGIEDDDHMYALKTNAAYSRLVQDLLISERHAERRGVGMWRRRSFFESVLSYPSQIRDIARHSSVYQFVVLFFASLKQISTAGYQGAKRLVGGVSRGVNEAIEYSRRKA